MSAPIYAVIGAGAVGLYYGGRLASNGAQVHFLARSDYQSLKQNGLAARSIDGNFHIRDKDLNVHSTPADMPSADVILIALKTTANDALPDLIPPLLKPGTILITLQNGLGNENTLAELFGPDRIMGGMCFTCINRDNAGNVDHLSHGLIRLGSFVPGNPHLHSVGKSLIQGGLPVEIIPDLAKGRWQKLIWNVPFNGLGAAYDLNTQQILSSPEHSRTAELLMREIMAASIADGSPFDPDPMIEHQFTQTRAMGPYKTSMQIDRQMNRPLEHQAIIGEPLARGLSRGIPMPETAKLYDILCNL